MTARAGREESRELESWGKNAIGNVFFFYFFKATGAKICCQLHDDDETENQCLGEVFIISSLITTFNPLLSVSSSSVASSC